MAAYGWKHRGVVINKTNVIPNHRHLCVLHRAFLQRRQPLLCQVEGAVFLRDASFMKRFFIGYACLPGNPQEKIPEHLVTPNEMNAANHVPERIMHPSEILGYARTVNQSARAPFRVVEPGNDGNVPYDPGISKMIVGTT